MLSVIQLYRRAWKKDGEKRTTRQRMLDIGVSFAVPLAVLWATVHTLRMYWNQEPDWAVLLILAGVMVPFWIFVRVCRFLLAEPEENKKNQPSRNITMLAFAAWSFCMGFVFTLAEIYDHLCTHIGPLNSNLSRSEFNSPWGDTLLAFSAFCMLLEEFSLLDLYDHVKRQIFGVLNMYDQVKLKVDEARNLSDDVKMTMDEISSFHSEAEKLYKQTEHYSAEVKDMHATMMNPVHATLKWSIVVGATFFLVVYIQSEIDRLMEVNHRLEDRLDEIINSGSPPNLAEPSPPAESAEPSPSNGDAVVEPDPPADAVEPGPSNVAEPGPPNDAKTDPPNDAETNDANVAEPNVAEPGSPNGADPSLPNVAEPNGADPSPPNVAEPGLSAEPSPPPQRRRARFAQRCRPQSAQRRRERQSNGAEVTQPTRGPTERRTAASSTMRG